MLNSKSAFLLISATLILASIQRSEAQTVGFAEAIDQLAISCGNDPSIRAVTAITAMTIQSSSADELNQGDC